MKMRELMNKGLTRIQRILWALGITRKHACRWQAIEVVDWGFPVYRDRCGICDAVQYSIDKDGNTPIE